MFLKFRCLYFYFLCINIRYLITADTAKTVKKGDFQALTKLNILFHITDKLLLRLVHTPKLYS